MTEMLINNKDISTFSARLMTFNVSGTAVTNNTSAAGNLLTVPILYGCTVAPRTVTVSLAFHPHELNESSRNRSVFHRLHCAAENIIAFESEIIGKPFEILLPDGYWYSCLYASSAPSEPDASGISDVTYTFNGIRHLPTVIDTVPDSGRIECLSNTKTRFRLIVNIGESALDTLTVCGITVNTLPAQSELIIDSVDGLITLDGVNKFGETDLIDFPNLNPGVNYISCSAAGSVTMRVEYTPVFV